MDELKQTLVEVGGIRLSISEEKPYSERENDDVPVDVFLFEPSYTVAGATGFVVWEGSWILIDLLKSSTIGEKIRGSRIVELGSGTGQDVNVEYYKSNI